MPNPFQNILSKAAGIVFAALISLGVVTAPAQPAQPTLGSQLPTSPALVDTFLASSIGSADTSMVLAKGTTNDGVSLAGFMCFTIDVNTPQIEYTCGTASGTAVSNLQRGIGFSNPNTTSSALAFVHRRYASVQSTDYPTLQLIVRQLTGMDSISSTALFYANEPAFSSGTQIVDKTYADNLVLSGAPNGSPTVKGIYQESTKAQTAAGNSTGSTGADLVVPTAYFNATSSATTTVPVTKTNGKLDTNFIDQTASATYSFQGGVTIASGTIGTTTYTGMQNFSGASVSGLGSYLTANFTVGAVNSLTAGQAVYIGNGTTGYLNQTQTASSTSWQTGYGVCDNNPGTCSTRVAQTFITSASTTAIRAVTAQYTTANDTNGITMQAYIYAVSGNAPTGAPLGTSNLFSPGVNITASTTNFTFSPVVAVSTGTQYAIVFQSNCVSGGDDCIGPQAGFFINVGAQYQSQFCSTFDGSVWSVSSTKELYFKTYTTQTTAGKVYPTDTTLVPFGTDTNEALGYAGFALNGAATGTSASILIGGITSNLTGLTPASTYYLNGASGVVSSTVGSPSVKVGMAVSSTAILIKFDNP